MAFPAAIRPACERRLARQSGLWALSSGSPQTQLGARYERLLRGARRRCGRYMIGCPGQEHETLMFALLWTEIAVTRSAGARRKSDCATQLSLSGALSSCAGGPAGGVRGSGTGTSAISCCVYGCCGRRSGGSAEPNPTATPRFFSHDIVTFSGLYSQQFFSSKKLQQGISKGQGISDDSGALPRA